MLTVETIGRIRREHLLKGKTIKQIARDLRVSRNSGHPHLRHVPVGASLSTLQNLRTRKRVTAAPFATACLTLRARRRFRPRAHRATGWPP
jgi:hypothetical protein